MDVIGITVFGIIAIVCITGVGIVTLFEKVTLEKPDDIVGGQ